MDAGHRERGTPGTSGTDLSGTRAPGAERGVRLSLIPAGPGIVPGGDAVAWLCPPVLLQRHSAFVMFPLELFRRKCSVTFLFNLKWVLQCFLSRAVFGRAIHAIARISDEFWFDPIEKGLALRSVNSSRSAYACVFFSSMFFQHYCWTAVSQPCQNEKQLSLPCKLIIKSVLPVFRCVNVLEKNVEKCSISTSPSDHHITFQLLCRHGVVKTYNLTFQECDPLQAVFAKHMCTNILKVHSRLLADVMIHFPTSQEEITLSVTPIKVCFKSYTEEDTDFSRTMLTEIQLSPEEFDYFQVGVDSEVTFCLKELRGLLAFSEATNMPVSIHFDRCGKPIAFSLEDLLLEASFILATLCEAEKEAASPETACCPRPWHSSRTAMDKSAQTSTDGASNTDTATSKKPQQKGNTPSMHSAKPLSALAKQESRNSYLYKYCIFQFHSLFFGAVSYKEKEALGDTFQSLVTASDTEEELGALQSSPVL
ncbi:PREDICTED: LOW QUALITY PROTEIN: cell cycle checkpoint control protein RAD9B [Pseudopodoces humilis]|uniref:LOW QUALITY PROTEIN: cell cycle checkpoint control protein RAD9B n=1 Tax=Pseudopodoces humilis TaxID=181119 RepID=UPI0006B73E86|nr:PREDICTED: LOW QUALITY PROTEIN: cell cycle checkpoint control protein RAD9B [Pseudopodoces humilis]